MDITLVNDNGVKQINAALLSIDDNIKTLKKAIGDAGKNTSGGGSGITPGGTYDINITGNAAHATIADSATTADTATTATTATSATNADHATTADSANTADFAKGIPFGTCTTAAATVAKEVTVTPAITTLTAGTTIAVKMENTNNASGATLNVNGTGAYLIKRYGTTNAGTNGREAWQGGIVQLFTFDGSYWYLDDFRQNAQYALNAERAYGSGWCNTDAATADKLGNLYQYTLQAGSTFTLYFNIANTAASALTLNMNSTGAKPIYINGVASSATNYSIPKGTFLVTYDGTNYNVQTNGPHAVTADYATTATTSDDHEIAYYGTCSTAAATVAKEVTISGFSSSTLKTGVKVAVKFDNANGVANPTLNVSGTGAKSIIRYGTSTAGTSDRTSWAAGAVQELIYDGTNWCLLDFRQNAEFAASADITRCSGVCFTDAGTADKTCSVRGWELVTGNSFFLYVNNANTYTGALTLNVSGTGAKALWLNGYNTGTANWSLTKGLWLVTYMGTVYEAAPMSTDKQVAVPDYTNATLVTNNVYNYRTITSRYTFTVDGWVSAQNLRGTVSAPVKVYLIPFGTTASADNKYIVCTVGGANVSAILASTGLIPVRKGDSIYFSGAVSNTTQYLYFYPIRN